MKIELVKASGKAICRHKDCSKNPDYISGSSGRIKKGTICCFMSVWGANGYTKVFFCRECLEKIYNEVKVKLNPKLWAFG